MATEILVVGESGTGKSTSIETLDPSSTFIIQSVEKDLPFRGYKKKYPIYSKDNKNGKRFVTNKVAEVEKILDFINSKEEIKTLIIDDSQYFMINTFFERALEKGYEKFSLIGQEFFNLTKKIKSLRSDLVVVLLHHSELKEDGRMGAKTVGKVLDNTLTIEGLFSIVLFAKVIDNNYFFETNTDGLTKAKSPRGMFEEQYLPNDLKLIIEKIKNYYEGDDE